MSSSKFQNQHIQDSDYKPREGIPDFPTAQGYRTYLAERIRTATSERNKAALLRYQKIANESEDPKTIKAGIDKLRPKTTTSQSSPITTSRKPKEYIPDFDTTKEYKEYFEGRHKICNAGDKAKFAEFIRISSMAKNTDDIKQGIAERKKRHALASRESRERAKQKKSDNLEEATSHLPKPTSILTTRHRGQEGTSQVASHGNRGLATGKHHTAQSTLSKRSESHTKAPQSSKKPKTQPAVKDKDPHKNSDGAQAPLRKPTAHLRDEELYGDFDNLSDLSKVLLLQSRNELEQCVLDTSNRRD